MSLALNDRLDWMGGSKSRLKDCKKTLTIEMFQIKGTLERNAYEKAGLPLPNANQHPEQQQSAAAHQVHIQ